MVSVDHFGHELRVQLRTATEQGAQHILINSTELCSSVRAGGASAEACVEAMEHTNSNTVTSLFREKAAARDLSSGFSCRASANNAGLPVPRCSPLAIFRENP
jgi:hypothetical protein